MTDYEDFKSYLQEQSTASQKNDWKQVVEKSRFLRRKMIITQLVLGVTIAVLIYFFFHISAQNVATVALALLSMIGVLTLRVALEFISMVWLRRLDYDSQTTIFSRQANKYYRFRKVVHFIITPLLYFTYFAGFVVLLPYFKDALSLAFYLYVLISGIVIFFVLGLFIGNEIRKEVKVLKTFREESIR